MSDSTEKSGARLAAEARRQKILASRNNRLAKITNTARNDEGAPRFVQDGPLAAPLAASDFLGDAIPPPVLPPPRPNTRARRPAQEDPAADAFSQALANAFASSQNSSALPGASAANDPFMAMMQTMTAGASNGVPILDTPSPAQKPSSSARVLPYLHLLSIMFLLVWAVAVGEPQAWRQNRAALLANDDVGSWDRWKKLGTQKGTPLDVQALPVFSVFLALQLILHSLRLFVDRNTSPPPGIVTTVLPYLPLRMQGYVIGVMKYMVIGQQCLDDVALVIFVLGIIVWRANW